MSKATQVEMLLAGISYGGNPVAAGKVYTYIAGTTSNKNTYTAQDQSATAANPVILDSQGRANIYADGLYKFVIKDSADNTLYTFDNLSYGQFDGTTLYGGTTTGSANSQVATCSPPIKGTIPTGTSVIVKAGFTCTSSLTLSVDSNSGTVQTYAGNLKSGQWIAGNLYLVTYTGSSVWLLANPSSSWVSWAGSVTYSGSGSMTFSTVSTSYFEYRVENDICFLRWNFTGTTGGVASNTLQATLPVTAAATTAMTPCYVSDAAAAAGYATLVSTSLLGIRKIDDSNFALAAGKTGAGQMFYKV